MQTIDAIGSLKGETSRQDLHMKWKRGHFVKVVVKGGIQVRNAQGKYDTVTPKREPVCWIKMEDVLTLQDKRRRVGPPITIHEAHEGKVKTLEASIS